MIEGDATLTKGCTLEQCQKYELKLSGFFGGLGVVWKRIQNVKYAKMVAAKFHDFESKLITYVLPSINSPGFSMIPSFQWFLMTNLNVILYP